MDWSITEVARLTGTTTRTLRHYDRIGLLAPSRVGTNGYRFYDEAALVRLQQVLLLRSFGVGLAEIGGMLADGADAAAALRGHLRRLEEERRRLARVVRTVRDTVQILERGGRLMAETMFDGFDHTRYEAEVEERWGRDAARRGSDWWSGMSGAERTAWQERAAGLAADWAAAAGRGVDPAGEEAQSLARRQVEWLAGIPGTPGFGSQPPAEYLRGLGELYVADERFAATYGGVRGAEFVRDALAEYAAHLPGEA